MKKKVCLLFLFIETLFWICKHSATLVDYEVDAFGAFSALIIPEECVRLPVARIDYVSNTLRVLEPPAVAIVA